MNIQKTNPIGIYFAKSAFIGGDKKVAELISKQSLDHKGELYSFDSKLLRFDPHAKVLRVSTGIIETCKLIDIDSIKENIEVSNLNFTSMYILLDNDKSGIIKVVRYGSDLSFALMSDLSDSCEVVFNTYNFLHRDFLLDKNYKNDIDHYNKSVFVIQLLSYIIFGDITEMHIPKKSRKSIGLNTWLNNSNLNITFCDTLWKQRINTDGFKVRGHFRLQPCGTDWKEKKLIWIEEFQKHGYNRRATVEIINDKP